MAQILVGRINAGHQKQEDEAGKKLICLLHPFESINAPDASVAATMSQPNNPADIAREALRRLASRHLQPTPDNFRRIYAEISGEPEVAEPRWVDALRPLLKQWDMHQTGLSQKRKQEMFDRVLINFGADGKQLQGKLLALSRSWAEWGKGEGAAADLAAENLDVGQEDKKSLSANDVSEPDDVSVVARTLVGNLELLARTCETRWPDMAANAAELAKSLGQQTRLDTAQLARWDALWRELLVRADDDHELTRGLRRLVGLLFLNIGELVGDEAWLSGQLATMDNLLKGTLQPAVLLEAERELRELAFKQGVLKGSLNDAKAKLKTLVTTFIDRIGEMTQSADGYHARIGEYSVRIGQATDIAELGDIVDGLTVDMAGMRDALSKSHQELIEARAQAEQAHERLHEMERELAMVSNLVREDQLTGALNRRGLDEALGRELARTERLNTQLAVGLLDIDHFKKLNDSLGHQAGDRALRHLANVIKTLLRPTDSLARYGGEEFLVLLPNTDVEEALTVMKRVQRELTRQFFLHNNEKVLITFSAGVAQHQQGENEAALIERADAAMYRAKRSGRNRVEVG